MLFFSDSSAVMLIWSPNYQNAIRVPRIIVKSKEMASG